MSKEIFKQILYNELDSFLKNEQLETYQIKALRHMYDCQTERMGLNVSNCSDCDYSEFHYNSCRDRNCVFCQSFERELWAENYRAFLVNATYFHFVFTVPDKLNPIFLLNKNILYPILMSASAITLNKMAASEKYNYGKIGFTSILHSWGRTMAFHPHVHSIVAGGGLKDNQWVSSKDNFFISVFAAGEVFRGVFLDLLKNSYASLLLCGDCEYLLNPLEWDNFISALYSMKWNVHAEPSFESLNHVIKYMARYANRIAISPSRVIAYDSDFHTVTFVYKDFKDNSKQKEMTLSAFEFLRRFSLHILPPRFVKIRHYGFIANNARKSLLPLVKKLTNTVSNQFAISKADLIEKTYGYHPDVCPKCGHFLIHRSLSRLDFSLLNDAQKAVYT